MIVLRIDVEARQVRLIVQWRRGALLRRATNIDQLPKRHTIGQSRGSECCQQDKPQLRLAQQALGTITGEVTADDLLGRIFSEFCIGK